MDVEQSRATGWVGWVLFGGVILVVLGTLHVYVGLLALVRPEILAGSRADLLFPVSLTGLAVAHLAVGAAAAVAGFGLVRGLRWARAAAVLLCCSSALMDFAFAATHPVWSVVAIALTGTIVYAVAAHGGEVADAYGP
ncbi:hypothetical protein QLQ12_42420 [Actinoplanes sp. NEAU-A12]|uniref:DUF7144 domain-containing protein n=1 Tax=Actinoplanes sandaracinus TaxID=3045177 RepID=A0ABT6X012_9ACTN|nr:hypothetical protein [Actinoplanes sandaracinus]MDI6105259.1 hypothetical protein [Actinoplanes sandaracinus]